MRTVARALQFHCGVWSTLARLARNSAAAPRRRALLVQIDGLSSARLQRALGRGEMPHLKRLLAERRLALSAVTAGSPPSTPVFQAGLLYGAGDVPGFGWYDRALGRVVRMDLPEDVLAVEKTLGHGPPLLRGGVSYGTIFPGGAAENFINVVWSVHGGAIRRARNLWDGLLSAFGGGAIAARVSSRFLLELGVGLLDFVRWCRRVGSTRFEWRFLYMRLFVAVVARELSTHGALVDVLRGVPIVYLDYLGYDEYAHRRGPDSELALFNLRGIDEAVGKLARAAASVPELGYDLFVFSDHGQTATTPFQRIMGRDLHQFVLEHAARTPVETLESGLVRALVELKESRLLLRSLWRPLRLPARAYFWWLARRLEARLDGGTRRPLDGIEVVTGGSIAHLYFGRRRLRIDTILRRWPHLVAALGRCPAVGVVLARGARGPELFYRGRRYRLDDRRRVAALPPFRALGYEVLRRHLEAAARGERSGDLVLYGAFAAAGSVSFDFEFGSHGGIGPEELDQFVLHPPSVKWRVPHLLAARDLYRFFRARYGEPPSGSR
jgi:Type I phosphodiesterase / nucleotide pyrophosphatase